MNSVSTEEPRRAPGKFLGFALFFVVIAALPPQALYWDDIGFLQYARDPIRLDYGHALYIPTLRLWHAVVSFFGLGSEEHAAKLLSALAAALFFVLLWSRLERMRIEPLAALAIALIVGTAPLFWRQATIVEPTTLTLSALLVAARCAERYGEKRSVLRAMTLCLACAVLLGYHVVSIFALPWIVHLSSGPAPAPPRRQLLIPFAFVLSLFLAVAAAGKISELPTFFRYWQGFLPAFDADALSQHLQRGAQILRLTSPAPLIAGGLGLLLALVRRRTPRGLWLGVPYFLAHALLGQPDVGLLLPVTLSLGLIAAEGFAGLQSARLARWVSAFFLPILCTFQFAFALVRTLERALTPDQLQESATLLAAALPDSCLLLAGPEAHHVLWFTDVPCIALPNEMHAAPNRPDGTKDVLAVMRSIVERESLRYKRVYVSSEALDYLGWKWNADPSTFPLDVRDTIRVRDAPPLFLVPLALEGIRRDP